MVVFLLVAGCSQQDRRSDIRAVRLTGSDGYLEFVARHRTNNQESKVGAGDTTTKETIFEENLKLSLDGYVYHPNLLDFTAGALFGLTQQEFEETFAGRRRFSRDEGPVTEFDFVGRFLQEKAYPGTVSARRTRTLEPRPFLSSLEVTAESYGVIWQYIDDKMPTTLQFNHTDVRLDPLNDVEEEGRQKNTQFRFETAYRFTDHNVLSFVYNRESHEERPFELNYDTDELTLGHRLDFGEGHRHRLDSELNYFNQKGTFDIERRRWRETLRLNHAENLRSWYLFEFLNRTQGNLSDVPPIEERSALLTGTVEHKLYESLVSQLTGFYQNQDFGGGPDIDRYGWQASFDYRKTNPFGVLLADYTYRAQKESRSGAARRFEIRDEVRTFRDPEPIVLTNQNIEPSSIFITAEDRTTAYQQGRDYRLEVFEDRVDIRRVPTGRIPDGTTVLIDYVFQAGSNFDLDTTTHHLGLRQNFDFGLSPYYRFRFQDQELSPPDAMGVTPNDITAHIVGVEYRQDPWRFSAEYEDHDSTINPFEAVRLTGDFTKRWSFGALTSLKARWSDIAYFPPNDRTTRFLSVEGSYRHPVTEHLWIEALGIYRTDDDSVSGQDEGVDLDLSLEWMYRQSEVRITYEFSQFDDDFSRSDSSALFVQVVRRF